MSKQVKPIHTSCKKCVFAVYDNITQTNCHLKYLDIYQNKKIDILEAYDEEKEFYVINDKKCLGYREPKWFDSLGMSESTIEEKIRKFHELNSINYFLILDTSLISSSEFDKTIENISKLKLQPTKLVIIRYISDDKSFGYSFLEDTFKKHNLSVKWTIHTVLDDKLSADDVLYQIIMQNQGSRFVAYTKHHSETLENLIDTTNRIVYEDLDQFNILSSVDKGNIIFSVGMYKYSIYHGDNILKDLSNYQTI